MRETMEPEQSSLTDQLKQVIRDGIDYITSAITLMQTRFAALALSSALFIGLLIFSALLALAAFILVSVALGLWLTSLTNSPAVSLLIMSVLYVALAGLAGSKALRWLKNVKS